jgi:uncharacterized repeat protein (TIGR02543 family)
VKRIGFALLAGLLLLLSCKSPLHNAGARPGMIKIAVSFPGAAAARTVVPNFALAVDEIEVGLTSNDGYASPANQRDTSPPWELVFGEIPEGSWKIDVTARRAGSTIGTGSVADCRLTSGSVIYVTVPLAFGTASTSGDVRFDLSVPPSTGIKFVRGEIEGRTEASDLTLTLDEGGRNSGSFLFPGLPSGNYSLVLTFRRDNAGGNIAGIFREKLVVVGGFESAFWVDSQGTLVPSRAFGDSEFFDRDASLFGLVSDCVLLPIGFDSSTHLYALDPVAGLPASVSFTPTESIAGQYLEYSWNNSEPYVEIRSSVSTPPLAIDEANRFSLRVTAPDRATQSEYLVTFARGYSLSYDGHGNTGGIAPVDAPLHASTDSVAIVGPGTLSRLGWSFAYWSETMDGTGQHYVPTDPFTMPARNVRLYAQWTINRHTVTFENQGESPIDPLILDYDSLVARPPVDPTRSGQAFLGWYHEMACITPWNFNVDRVPNSDVAIFAKWVPTYSFTLSFTIPNPSYGAIVFNPTTKSITNAMRLVIAPDPPLVGARGWHWYVDGNDTGQTGDTLDMPPGPPLTLGQHIVSVDAMYGDYPCTGSIRVTVTYP